MPAATQHIDGTYTQAEYKKRSTRCPPIGTSTRAARGAPARAPGRRGVGKHRPTNSGGGGAPQQRRGRRDGGAARAPRATAPRARRTPRRRATPIRWPAPHARAAQALAQVGKSTSRSTWAASSCSPRLGLPAPPGRDVPTPLIVIMASSTLVTGPSCSAAAALEGDGGEHRAEGEGRQRLGRDPRQRQASREGAGVSRSGVRGHDSRATSRRRRGRWRRAGR